MWRSRSYDHELFVRYTASIIEYMGGRGPNVVHAAREIYGQWATNHHFELYDDVEPVLRDLVERGYVLGAISNSHRSLDAFCDHFSLRGLIHATVSSFEHGYLKPHPSIFEEALERAGADASSSLMVGDSVKADIAGALAAGMRAVLLATFRRRAAGHASRRAGHQVVDRTGSASSNRTTVIGVQPRLCRRSPSAI